MVGGMTSFPPDSSGMYKGVAGETRTILFEPSTPLSSFKRHAEDILCRKLLLALADLCFRASRGYQRPGERRIASHASRSSSGAL